MTLQPNQELTLRISHLGGLGDGVGQYAGMPVFVPFTTAEDEARVRIISTGKDHARAELLEILTPSPARKPAPCIHFTACGGCTLQHLADSDYEQFKRNILTQTIKRLGYDTELVAPLIATGAHSRRRTELTLQVHKGEVRLGFLMPRSHQLVDIEMCPVLEPALFDLLAPFKLWATTIRKPQRITSLALTLLDDGIDMQVQLREKLSPDEQQSLRVFAESQTVILRVGLALDGSATQRLFQRQATMVTLGGTPVELPEGAFLQASRAGQDALTMLVLKYTEGATRIADIYSGCGTYSFPLAARGQAVHGFEGDADMVQAAQNAARRVGLESHASFLTRDLFRTPLSSAELSAFDAIVINPPRNGAGPQMKHIAQSGVARVVIVSCNPATFERDAVSLKQAGYRLIEATAVDQFVWSGHLELVASFEKH